MSIKIITEEMLTILREKAVEGMSDKRRIHTLAVEQMALRIGAIYAPDKINILRAAALLHDITKEIKLQGQLELCEKYGIEVSENDKLAPKTFHAKTAAKVLEDRYSEYADDDVVSAVRWHTTGREGMSICEKIIYLADYIDDSRKFSDCVKLREYFWGKDIAAMSETERREHLRDTLILSYDMTILNLLDENSPVAKDTFDARNELICERLKANNLKG
jgi:nicotinate-nucleotide adenylyltransferase